MKSGWMAIFFLLATALIAPMQIDDWQRKTLTLKIIVYDDGRAERYEFYQPNRFFYCNGERKFIGMKAKNKFAELFRHVQLTETASLESLLSQMKKSGYQNLNRLEIRWMNAKKELYTWVWDSEQTE